MSLDSDHPVVAYSIIKPKTRVDSTTRTKNGESNGRHREDPILRTCKT